MPNTLRLLATLALAGAIAACTTPQPVQKNTAPLVELPQATTGLIQYTPATLEIDGQLALLYQSRDERVTFKLGERTLQLDDSLPIKGGNRFQLRRDGQHIYATWWSPKNSKALYIATSQDGGKTFSPPALINDGQNALPPYGLMLGKQGMLGAAYMDERSPRFQVFANRSTDHGLTWPKPDLQLNQPTANTPSMAMFPQVFSSDQAWVVTWTETVESMGRPLYRIMARRSTDQGQSWSEPVALLSESAFLSAETSAQAGGHFVMAFDAHGKGIQALVSTDHGQTWKQAKDLGGTSNAALSNSGIQLAIGKDQAHAVWIEEAEGSKARIMYASLDMNTGQWMAGPTRLDVKEFDNTMSTLPDIQATPTGELIAAWMDFRDIRPNLYLSASFDQGAHWTAPQPVTQPGMLAVGYQQLIPWKNGLALSYQSFSQDDEQSGVITIIPLKLIPGKGLDLPDYSHTKLPEAKREELLKQRVEAFWKHRISGQFAESYPFFDPAYKKAFNLDTFMQTQGMLIYHEAKPLETKISGNEAEVKLKIKYESKPLMVSGKPVSVPVTEVEVTNTWVWIGDNWYMVYKPTTGAPFLKY